MSSGTLTGRRSRPRLVVEDGVEAGPVAVGEVLVSGSRSSASFLRVAQQRVGELRQVAQAASPSAAEMMTTLAAVPWSSCSARPGSCRPGVAWGRPKPRPRSLRTSPSWWRWWGGDGGGRQGQGRGGEGRGGGLGGGPTRPPPPALQRRGFRAGRWRLSATWLLETRPSTLPAPQFGIPLACRSGAAFSGRKGRIGMSSCSGCLTQRRPGPGQAMASG